MPKDDHYYPTDKDRAVFKRIITAVIHKPDWFAPRATTLDRDYSTQSIRDRYAAKLREHRANPNHTKRSRAFQRKYCQHDASSQKLEFNVTPNEVVPSPPKRVIGSDGKPQQPAFSLQKRFRFAFQDTFEDESDLYVLELHERLDIAVRRVLLAWLRLDPDRGSIRPITEFQRLRNKPTKDGNGPMWIPGDAELQNWDESLFMRQDGGIGLDAPIWIEKAQVAIDFLESQVDSVDLSSSARHTSRITLRVNATPSHSPDFTSVDWFGTRYSFAKGNQAQAIKVLWKAWKNGNHSLAQETIGEWINSSAERFELRKTFRRRKSDGSGFEQHQAWGVMIQQDGKGNYRLASPESA